MACHSRQTRPSPWMHAAECASAVFSPRIAPYSAGSYVPGGLTPIAALQGTAHHGVSGPRPGSNREGKAPLARALMRSSIAIFELGQHHKCLERRVEGFHAEGADDGRGPCFCRLEAESESAAESVLQLVAARPVLRPRPAVAPNLLCSNPAVDTAGHKREPTGMPCIVV